MTRGFLFRHRNAKENSYAPLGVDRRHFYELGAAVVNQVNDGERSLSLAADSEQPSVPIRLTQTPARCRVRPRAGIKVGIGRRLNPARNAEQRAERVERVESPVEAERELIEVGL